MKKILISIAVVAAIALYAVFASRSSAPAVSQPATTGGNPNIALNPTSTPDTGNNPPATSTGTGPAPKSGQYKDGTYNGPVADAIYGRLQVVATVQNGKLASIQVPVYPTDGGHTLEVSQQSLPILKQEAITAQSANIDIISGATQTSQAFQQSLAAALAMAK